MTTIKISLLIAGLLLISACGSIKQVAVVSHKTSSLKEKEIVAPTPVPETENVVLPKEPEQQVVVLSESVVIEVEPPPQARLLPAPEPLPCRILPLLLLNVHYQDSALLIEGHCDERGTIEYNLVLGERRAQAVKTYLVDLGIAASKIQTISYGKEKPFCTRHSVQCWQQNRRAHFVLR